MKPMQARIADLWCEFMHEALMWPAHGHYECRTCGRRHAVCWERPLRAASRARVARREALVRGGLLAAAESSVRYS